MLTLSGRTAGALRQSAIDYGTWLEQHEDASLADVCYTANIGRNHFEHRGALVFDSAEQLRAQLAALGSEGIAEGLHVGEVRRTGAKAKVAFLFTGQGSQYPGMGRVLYEQEAVFREAMDRCAAVFDEVRGETRPLGLLEVMFGEHEDELRQTGYTQPALFALEVSLAALWRSWGIEPAVVLGHSVGEYSAACVAGVFSLEQGLRLIAERGIGRSRSALILALPELARRYFEESLPVGQAIRSPTDTQDFLHAKIRHLGHEMFCCLYLDNRHRVLRFDELFRGTIDGTSVYPREVVKEALAINAAAVQHSVPQ